MFPETATLFGALLVGLFSSVHCIGMCGGIAGLLSAGHADSTPGRLLSIQLLYSAGRLSSYMVAGAASGALGQLLTGATGLELMRMLLQGAAGVVMLLLGIHLTGWRAPLAGLERAGGRLWRHIEPHGRSLLPIRSARAALGVGLLWGWLPCGLVYSALVWAVASGGAVDGALLMLAFGLGTLPSVVGAGLVGGRLQIVVRAAWMRALAGSMVAGLGLFSLTMLVMRYGGGGMGH